MLWAPGGAGFSVRGIGQGVLGSLRVASRQAARCLDGLPSHPHRVLVLLADGLCGNQVEVVRGTYTSQISGARVLNQAVDAAAIADPTARSASWSPTAARSNGAGSTTRPWWPWPELA